MPDPTLAHTIRVERRADGDVRVLVDGERLPFEVDPGGVRVITAAGFQPGITITIPAETVEVVDSILPAVPEEHRQHVTDVLASKAPPSSWRPEPRR